jgi:hypothetical protein
LADHSVPLNGAPSQTPFIPPNLWDKGDIGVSVWNLDLNRYEMWVADPESGEPIRRLDPPAPYVPPSPVAITLPKGPSATIERRGPRAWVVDVGLAEFTFRNVTTHRDLSADITVMAGPTRILRSTNSLSLTGRTSFAKACVSRAMGYGSPELWADAVFMAFEAILDAQETLGDGADLRTHPVSSMTQEFLFEPIWPLGPSLLVAPGEIGKSTLARAMAVSLATGCEVIPGMLPRTTGPVLYIAAEDVQPGAHARSIEAICRGAGIDRATIPYLIRFQPVTGQELHHIASTIAEMAADYVGVILDAQQGLMAVGEQVRNETTIFWNAIDQIGRPVFVVSHPNKMNSQQWADSDGRAAGSEVTRDRPRMTWMMSTKPLPSASGTYHSVMTLANTKNNDGPRYEAPIHIGRTWSPGMVSFSPASAPPKTAPAVRPTKHVAVMETLARLWGEGKRSVTTVQQADPDGLGKLSRAQVTSLLTEMDAEAGS